MCDNNSKRAWAQCRMRHLILLQVFLIILQYVEIKGPNKYIFETETEMITQ